MLKCTRNEGPGLVSKPTLKENALWGFFFRGLKLKARDHRNILIFLGTSFGEVSVSLRKADLGE